MTRGQSVVVAGGLGGIAAWQAPVNGRLGEVIGAVPATATSFLSGAIFLAVALFAAERGSGFRVIPVRLKNVRLRDLSGGLIGAGFVLMALITVSDLGAGGLAAASVAGTLIGGVSIDWTGAVGVRRSAPGAGTWIGVLLLLGATLLITGGAAAGFAVVPTVVALVVSVLVAFQPPINARFAAKVGDLQAALVQTLIGFGALLPVAVAAILLETRGVEATGLPWWAWIGGPLGGMYVIATLKAVPAIGAAGVAAASIGGGLAFGVVADELGMFGLTPVPLSMARLLSVAMLCVGAALVLRQRAS